jgi:hypothetical protein
MEPVHCTNCGYLSVRNVEDWSLGEAESDYRETGAMSDRAAQIYRNLPICFARAANLLQEYERTCNERPGGISGPAAVIKFVLHKPRTCTEHIEWQQGFTPKEHLEMKMLEEQRASLNREADRNHRWRIIELVVMGLIVTAVSVAAQIGSAFIERGSLFPAPQQPAAPPVVQLVMPQQPTPPDVGH